MSEINVNFMQGGKTVACGACEPSKFEHCDKVKEKFGYICKCICHQIKEELLAKSKEQGYCECCGADLPKLNLPTSKWEE